MTKHKQVRFGGKVLPTRTHADAKAEECTNTHRFGHGIFGLFSSSSSSVFRQMCAVVRAEIHHSNIKLSLPLDCHALVNLQ